MNTYRQHTTSYYYSANKTNYNNVNQIQNTTNKQTYKIQQR